MATAKKASKPPVKKGSPAKKAAPAKKVAAPAKKAAAPAKKAAATPAKHAAAPARKAEIPAKKPVAKAVAPVAKKAAVPEKKVAPPAKHAEVAKAEPVKAKTKKASAKPVVHETPSTQKVANVRTIVPKGTLPKKPGALGKKVVVPVKKAEEPMRSMTPPPPQKKRPVKEEVKNVKMPTITAKGKVAYDPDFTVSVLDSPKEEMVQSSPSQRYSDSDLHEFKELIMRKLEAARKELAYLHGLKTRKDEMGGDNDDSRYMTMEDGSLSMEREQLSQMASRQIQFIDHLEKSLIRIENKTYGICRVTGKLIDKARLRAVPHATLSMEAKLGKPK